VPLQSGANTIAVSAKAGSGATATRTLSVTSTYPHVHITSPTDGASFSTDRVLVTGTVQAPANSGVIVNGVVAVVSGTQFFASNVPLSLGVNTVTATATSPTGKQAVHSITATSNSASAVQISATPIQGIAPLTVSFVATSTGNPVASWQANPGAAGSLDTSDPSALFKFTYTQPGVYQASVRVTDSAGQVYTQTIVIGVADTTQMDLLFRSIWSGLNTALVSGDKGTAMSYLTGSARDKYGPVFNVLLPYMPDIVTSYSPLKRGSISQNIGEYAVIRNDGALKRAYFVYFVRDSDGVWRVDEM
jgi:hypothetical protein